MRLKAALITVAMILGLLAGCSTTPHTTDAAAEVVRAFMKARTAGDVATVYGKLTARAQKAMTKADVADFLGSETIRYDALGSPRERETDWVQIPIQGLVVGDDSSPVRWPEVALTLHYEGSQWRVAWADPLMVAAARAYDRSAYGEELDLGRTIADIDPYHFRGYLEQHFAYQGLKQPREAELWLNRAATTATAVEKPSVEDAAARFKLSLKHPEDAIPHAQAALELAAPYSPYLYAMRWQADTTVVLARALLAGGDRTGAADAANRAAGLDPQNGSLAIFRLELSPPQPSPLQQSAQPAAPSAGQSTPPAAGQPGQPPGSQGSQPGTQPQPTTGTGG